MAITEEQSFDAQHRRAVQLNDHVGLSPEDATRTALGLIRAAAKSEVWIFLPGHLEKLRQQTQPHPAIAD